MAALGSLAHKASQHQANLEGEPGWCSAGAHQPPNGVARWSPRTPGASLRGGGRTWAPQNHHPGLGAERADCRHPAFSSLPLGSCSSPSLGCGWERWRPCCSGQTLPVRATFSPAGGHYLTESQWAQGCWPPFCLTCRFICCPPSSLLSPDIQVGFLKSALVVITVISNFCPGDFYLFLWKVKTTYKGN